jgi:aminobenzoyl-glutamate utilization protein B
MIYLIYNKIVAKMKKNYPILIFLTLWGLSAGFAQAPKKLAKNKQLAIESVEKHQADLIQLSNQIWKFAETALRENQSAKVLADYAEAQGFKVERNVAEMPSAFIASYGSGKPIIGILGEFDALPGLSQKASPQKEALEVGKAGHGCGHNLFGAGSLGAAIAIKDLIMKGLLKGTIRFYGTPAEEAVGGKIYMARAGLFNDLDVCLDWHPSDDTKASVQSSQALLDISVIFKGKAAHAAYDPWNGRSALDGLELFTTGVNMLREHIKPSVRMHYVMKKGGDVPNVVPEYAELWMWIRDSKRTGVEEVFQRVKKIAEGAALMTETEYQIKINTGDYEILVNRTGAKAMHENLLLLGNLVYTEEEINFAKKIQQATGKEQTGINGKVMPLEETMPDPPGGSSDVGDVSWIVPEISLVVTTAPSQTPWHSWPVVACGGMSIGHKGLIYAAKAMALTMIDLYENEKLRQEMKVEFIQKKGNQVYKPYIPEGPPPVPTEK